MIAIALVALLAIYAAYRYGKRDQWIEPHCYCRGDKPGHACLTECWLGHRARSTAYQRHIGRKI